MGAPYEEMQDLDQFKMVCVSCGKVLSSELRRQGLNSFIPMGGLVLRSHGNYGSRVFDPIDKDIYLQLYLCDDCAKTKRDHILLIQEHKHNVIRHQLWEDSPLHEVKGQNKVDALFDKVDFSEIISEIRKEDVWDSSVIATKLKKWLMEKMIKDEFPMQNVLNVQVYLGPKENDIQIRIAIDGGVVFFMDEED